MKILAFDTSTTACSVAIQNGDQVKCLHQIAPMQQAKLILPMIHELLEASSVTLEQLDAIAYGCGPGSFTGIRIASSVVQGIGFGTQKPIIKISSLAALAQAAYLEQHCAKMLIAVDARMDQIYWACYEAGKTGCVELVDQELLCRPEDVSIPVANDWSGVGDGWGIYTQQISSRLGFTPSSIYSSQLPSAQAMLQLARIKYDKNEWIAASEAVPVYLR